MNLGKKLHIGQTFHTVTKRMTKNRHSGCQLNKELDGPLITYEVLRPGAERIFEKGKRKYLCKVIAIIETRTGLHHWQHFSHGDVEYFDPWNHVRYWQFTYLVKIIEN